MERQVKVIGLAKWLCIPLGCIMFYGTVNSFGPFAARILSLAAMAGFFILMRSEQNRLIGETIAEDIRDAIQEVGDVESFVEVRRMKSGILARVYLVNAREKAIFVQRAITRKLEECSMKKYLWVMQLTDMPARDNLEETQQMLNEKLFEELLRNRKGE
ncbi:MAG: hypothetical protein IKI99_00090 [Firmicutes bacterium]|nr:hypothetical protein [Bacillota bacterium]